MLHVEVMRLFKFIDKIMISEVSIVLWNTSVNPQILLCFLAWWSLSDLYIFFLGFAASSPKYPAGRSVFSNSCLECTKILSTVAVIGSQGYLSTMSAPVLWQSSSNLSRFNGNWHDKLMRIVHKFKSIWSTHVISEKTK